MTTTSQQNVQEERSQEIQAPQNNVTTEVSHAPGLDEWIKEKPRHNYIRLEVNGPRVLRFKSDKPNEMLMSDFGGKLKEKKPIARYMVTTPEESKEEQVFDVTAKRLASEIQFYYGRGDKELEITKLNTSPVSYRVIPMIARERQRSLAGTQ
jgi:hypothetical protein